MLVENNGKRRTVLSRLKNEMEQLSIPSTLVRKGEENSPFDILVCTHTKVEGAPDGTVTGQYFFPEVEAAENVCYFTCMMTIKQGLTEDEKRSISSKMEEINLSLVCGQFAIYPEIGLVYKLCFPISEELVEEDLFDTVDIAAAHAFALTGTYVPELLA
ncbi:MAG: hypothetical protein K6F00_02590 [Lachnospiraceae bacterium]|nr:hypothetical protein [Lachnospiraceae bacterium]